MSYIKMQSENVVMLQHNDYMGRKRYIVCYGLEVSEPFSDFQEALTYFNHCVLHEI